MGRDTAALSAAARAAFDAADRELGFGLSRLCFEGPEDELRRTENQQPAILATSIALLRALEERCAPAPAFVAGHSLGEYSALVAANALDYGAALRTVRLRGRFMQEAVAEGAGAMAAILGCDAGLVARVCSEVEAAGAGLVAPANFNSPVQTVIAGASAAVGRACERLRELGAKRTVDLPVSAPFHCALMQPAARRLAAELAKLSFREATPPVVCNRTATANADPQRMPALLEEQVTAPVRFVEMIAFLAERGVRRVIEIGPGRVLTGLVRRIDRRIETANLACAEDLAAAAEFVGASA